MLALLIMLLLQVISKPTHFSNESTLMAIYGSGSPITVTHLNTVRGKEDYVLRTFFFLYFRDRSSNVKTFLRGGLLPSI